MKIVVDTNIVFSAILNSQSWIGHILLYSGRIFKFYSPRFLQTEIQNHRQKIKKYTNLSDTEIDELVDTLYARITFISEELIPKEILLAADELTNNVDYDDVMFVALAINFNCKLWTGDMILMHALKQKGFKRFITTDELKKKLTK